MKKDNTIISSFVNAVLVFDNVLWKGEVEKGVDSPKANSLRGFNKTFTECSKIEGSIFHIGDGVAAGVYI